MVDNNENIYVEFDCNNITLVNPNKVVDVKNLDNMDLDPHCENNAQYKSQFTEARL